MIGPFSAGLDSQGLLGPRSFSSKLDVQIQEPIASCSAIGGRISAEFEATFLPAPGAARSDGFCASTRHNRSFRRG